MKIKIDWKKFLLFAVISFGLVVVTESLWMSAGILLLLFVVDHFIVMWEMKRKRNKECND